MSSPVLCAVVATVLLGLCGCESTIDQARKITASGVAVIRAERGVAVGRTDPRIHVLATQLLSDANGTAVIVELRNTWQHPIAAAPIAVTLQGHSGQPLPLNEAPGLEVDLTHVPLLPPGAVTAWVDDQVASSLPGARVVVRVGAGVELRQAPPTITVSRVQISHDPVSGDAATGTVENASRVAQAHLVLFAVARRGRRIVAAGRAIVVRLAARGHTIFHAYLIGSARGATVTVTTPPSVLH